MVRNTVSMMGHGKIVMTVMKDVEGDDEKFKDGWDAIKS